VEEVEKEAGLPLEVLLINFFICYKITSNYYFSGKGGWSSGGSGGSAFT